MSERQTVALNNITLWQDWHRNDRRYGLTMTTSDGETVWLSLSNMSKTNPDRIKLERWAEEQLCKSKDSN